MIRELAENPNVHMSLHGDRELVTDPDGRYVVYLNSGTSPRSATVQRVRLAPDEVQLQLPILLLSWDAVAPNGSSASRAHWRI